MAFIRKPVNRKVGNFRAGSRPILAIRRKLARKMRENRLGQVKTAGLHCPEALKPLSLNRV
jgi:hypothetical protein